MSSLTIEEMDRHTHLFNIGFTPDMFGELLTSNINIMGTPTQQIHPFQTEIDYIKEALDNPLNEDVIIDLYELLREYEESGIPINSKFRTNTDKDLEAEQELYE